MTRNHRGKNRHQFLPSTQGHVEDLCMGRGMTPRGAIPTHNGREENPRLGRPSHQLSPLLEVIEDGRGSIVARPASSDFAIPSTRRRDQPRSSVSTSEPAPGTPHGGRSGTAGAMPRSSSRTLLSLAILCEPARSTSALAHANCAVRTGRHCPHRVCGSPVQGARQQNMNATAVWLSPTGHTR